ncbi:DUF1249 domain-containing protein, partial [Salmonella enterica subsp. enterica serovar Infantis]
KQAATADRKPAIKNHEQKADKSLCDSLGRYKENTNKKMQQRDQKQKINHIMDDWIRLCLEHVEMANTVY